MTAIPKAIKNNAKTKTKTNTEAIPKVPTVSQNPEDQIQFVPLELIYPAAGNRKEFDREKMIELADSIRIHGVQQPIVLREREPDAMADQLVGKRYEIVMGERRWRACGDAGFDAIPARIVKATDQEAAELRAVENLQREDLRAIDEARAYQQLIDLGHNIEKVMERVGKSRSVVYARLALLKLPAKTMKALDSGELPASHAELITKLETPQMQEAFTNVILQPAYDADETGILAFREAREQLDDFQKREFNDREFNRLRSEFQASGHPVLDQKASEQILNYGSPKRGSGYEVLHGVIGNQDYTPWERALGKKGIALLTPTLAQTDVGAPVVIYKTEDLQAAAKAIGYTPKKPGSGGGKSESEKERTRQCGLRRTAHQEIVGDIVYRFEKQSSDSDLWWTIMLQLLLNLFDADAVKRTVKRRWDPKELLKGVPTHQQNGRLRDVLKERAAEFPRNERRALLVELVCQGMRFWPSEWDDASNDTTLAAIAKQLGYDANEARVTCGLPELEIPEELIDYLMKAEQETSLI